MISFTKGADIDHVTRKFWRGKQSGVDVDEVRKAFPFGQPEIKVRVRTLIN